MGSSAVSTPLKSEIALNALDDSNFGIKQFDIFTKSEINIDFFELKRNFEATDFLRDFQESEYEYWKLLRLSLSGNVGIFKGKDDFLYSLLQKINPNSFRKIIEKKTILEEKIAVEINETKESKQIAEENLSEQDFIEIPLSASPVEETKEGRIETKSVNEEQAILVREEPRTRLIDILKKGTLNEGNPVSRSFKEVSEENLLFQKVEIEDSRKREMGQGSQFRNKHVEDRQYDSKESNWRPASKMNARQLDEQNSRYTGMTPSGRTGRDEGHQRQTDEYNENKRSRPRSDRNYR